ncbi:hypothetical protein D3C72_701850 [compost metagenome]
MIVRLTWPSVPAFLSSYLDRPYRVPGKLVRFAQRSDSTSRGADNRFHRSGELFQKGKMELLNFYH